LTLVRAAAAAGEVWGERCAHGASAPRRPRRQLATLAHHPARAQTYPTKPLSIVVSLAAGTGMDVIVRLYADKLSQGLGQPAVVHCESCSKNIVHGSKPTGMFDGCKKSARSTAARRPAPLCQSAAG
jgi:hypothetical protein